MMPDPDIPSAARRVADDIRTAIMLDAQPDDMLALLPVPVLDAVAMGRDDAGRVERWARALRSAKGLNPDATVYAGDTPHPAWTLELNTARAAVALADAERKTASAGAWQLYEAARLDHEMAAVAHMRGGSPDFLYAARAALDAAVRRLAGVAKP